MRNRFVLVLLLALVPVRATGDSEVVSGRFDILTPYERPPIQSRPNVSRMYVRRVSRAQPSVDLPVTGGGDLVVWSAAAIELHAPSNLRPGESPPVIEVENFELAQPAASELGLAAGAHHVRRVIAANAGMYRLDVVMPEGDAAGVVVAVAEPESPVRLVSTVKPLSRQPQEPITLR